MKCYENSKKNCQLGSLNVLREDKFGSNRLIDGIESHGNGWNYLGRECKMGKQDEERSALSESPKNKPIMFSLVKQC